MVHALEPAGWRAAELPPGVVVRRLGDEELIALSSRSDAIGSHRFYLQRHGVNGAWGLFADGELAAAMWAFTPADHARLPFAALRPAT